MHDKIRLFLNEYKSKVITIVIFILGFSIGYVTNNLTKDTKNTQIEQTVNENINLENKDIKESENTINKEVENNNIKIETPVEDGFKTTIVDGESQDELITKNFLVPESESKISVKDRLEAKRVAENFVQAISSFDIEKPKETVEKATKYVHQDKVKEIESQYIFLGKNKDIKKTIIEDLYSEEERNKEDNDYLYFRVSVNWSVIDKYNQKVNGSSESYIVQLLKVDGQYKVFQYHID
ncbi:hypothetical protein [Clostridium faecium]|uniref:hypothetical protein n=1 Tax=Clostridium faecium TaxID=2762223 RepID=UPI0028BD331F|nr:hypothetical protein [Clostridium faecium]